MPLPWSSFAQVEEPRWADSPDALPRPHTIEQAILWTVAYADLFDYPLTAAEIHRYLVACAVPASEVEAALRPGAPLSACLTRVGEYHVLVGREASVQMRQQRAHVAARMWPRAYRYGHWLSRLPFVRMVAVTGALAVDNVEPWADIDYLIVTEVGRLWLCRALVIALVRLAARRGDEICPNYFLSERALHLSERNLFTARELAQMVPLSGLATYQEMRRLNDWTAGYLPNAAGAPRPIPAETPQRGRALAEAALRHPVGGWLDRWEMERKIRKFQRTPKSLAEAAFSPDWCKGHFDGHGTRILTAFATRLRALEADGLAFHHLNR